MNSCVKDREYLLSSNQIIRSIVNEMMVEGEKVIRIHTAWQLENGSILLYEYSSRNNPSSTFIIYDNLNCYEQICEELQWVLKG